MSIQTLVMRAITVQQPWAWAIIHGGKDIENRTRNIAGKYRGPIAIHAGKAESRIGAHDERVLREMARLPGAPTLFKGAIIGVVDLVDEHRNNHGHRLIDGCCRSEWADQWGGTGAHLVLANPRPLTEPISCLGALGLWTPRPALLAQLQEALDA